jgi:hypothetical protein
MTTDDMILVLNRHELDVIFQVTYDLSNFGESRLVERGCSESDLNALLLVLRALRDRATEQSTILIKVRDERLSSVADGLEEEVISGWIPKRIAQRWSSLAEIVTSGHSGRELFLRTGYEIDDIRRSLARLAELTIDEG